MQEKETVLIIDDDPAHLRIYAWIMEASGYRALPVEVRYAGISLPEEHAGLVLLDYNLAGKSTAVEIAKLVRSQLPGVPIVLLSDRWELPADIAPFVQDFVRKGEPAKLVATLHKLLRPPP
jgi:DNA-binding response OmpR family regulator